MLGRVHVEHELRDGAVQASQWSGHDGKACTSDLGRGVEIQHAQPCAELDVVLDREVELARLAHPAHLHVVVRRSADRCRFVRQVRDGKQERFEVSLDICEFPLPSRQLRLVRFGRPDEFGRIDSLRFGLTDLLRNSVLCCLRVLNGGLDLFSSLLQSRELIPIDLDPPRRDARSDSGQILPQKLYI